MPRWGRRSRLRTLNAYKILGGVLILLGVLCLAKDEKDDEAGEAEAAPVRAGE